MLLVSSLPNKELPAGLQVGKLKSPIWSIRHWATLIGTVKDTEFVFDGLDCVSQLLSDSRVRQVCTHTCNFAKMALDFVDILVFSETQVVLPFVVAFWVMFCVPDLQRLEY